MIVKPLRRTGLHRLVCRDDCGCAVYMTMAQLERGPLPVCGCGAPFLPEHPDLWHLAPRDVMEGSALLEAFARECASVQHGQASHIQRGREVRSDLEISGERIARAVQTAARERQLAGLKQYADADRASDDIPF